jgi:hypothetical protein
MTMKNLALVVLFAAAACGGKKGGGTTPPPTGGGEGEGAGETNVNNSATMVSAETMDEITSLFQRKGNAVSRCLAIVIDNKELPKNSRGKITLEVTITPAGKPERIKVLKASLDSKPLHDCVIERVKEIQFPTLPNTYPTTYTYAFEAS